MPLSALLVGDLAIATDTIPSICAGLAENLRRRWRDIDADVSVIVGPDALAKAAPTWRLLEHAGGAATPFQSLALAEAAAPAHRAQGNHVRIAIVREHGRPMVLLPCVNSRLAGISTLRFLGDPLIQYGDALAAPDARPEHIEAALAATIETAGSRIALLRKVRADARLADALKQRAAAVATEAAPFVDLAAAPTHSARDERERRRLLRRLSEHGPVDFDIQYGMQARPIFEEALELKREWLATRGLASRVIGDALWEAAALSMTQEPNSILAAARLTAGGRTAAIEIALVNGTTWYAFLGATTAAFAKAGPGHVQMAETIARCRRKGLAVYDLLAPDQGYKRAMATGAVAVHDYALALDLRGRAVLSIARLMPTATARLSVAAAYWTSRPSRHGSKP